VRDSNVGFPAPGRRLDHHWVGGRALLNTQLGIAAAVSLHHEFNFGNANKNSNTTHCADNTFRNRCSDRLLHSSLLPGSSFGYEMGSFVDVASGRVSSRFLRCYNVSQDQAALHEAR
jgi:hypothetical protein